MTARVCLSRSMPAWVRLPGLCLLVSAVVACLSGCAERSVGARVATGLWARLGTRGPVGRLRQGLGLGRW